MYFVILRIYLNTVYKFKKYNRQYFYFGRKFVNNSRYMYISVNNINPSQIRGHEWDKVLRLQYYYLASNIVKAVNSS